MLRQPEARYAGGRNGQLLKLKSEYDDECTVTRHYEGKGRNVGRLGAVGCKNQYGEFVSAAVLRIKTATIRRKSVR